MKQNITADPDRESSNKKKTFKSVCDNLEKKFLAFPMWKKVFAVGLFVLVFLGIGFQVYDMQDISRTTTITYSKFGEVLCEDVYTDGVLVNTTCVGLYSNIERYNPYDKNTPTVNMDAFNITIN